MEAATLTKNIKTEKTREILKSIRKVEIKTKKLVEGLLSGSYKSVFKGRGIEFSEVREYVPGDDIRTIDWNVTAKMNHPYVKEFIEERDLTVYFLFDISASGEFGSKKEKKESAIEICASIMFSAINNNDRVGLLMFSDKVERYVPPRKGKRHVLSLIREMLYYESKNKTTNIYEALRFATRIIKRKSVIFLVSDFFDDSKDYKKYLSILKRRHDVIAINLRDEREFDIPNVGYIELEDEETGEQILVNTNDPMFLKNFKELSNKENKHLENTFKRQGIDMLMVKSGERFDAPLKRLFMLREKRMSR
ncbi:MAG: DUF58 domain-containing protein [Candidatus Woesearchaeota archaeon]|jgi:uncharacterized protein (DUF58 family)